MADSTPPSTTAAFSWRNMHSIALSPSEQLTLTTFCTLLLLALLRLNRIIVPWLLRRLRDRRIQWIHRVPDDVHRELKRYPNQRSLCAGACCRISYGSFDNNETSTTSGSTDDGTSPTKESGGKSVASVQKWISAVYAEYCAQPDAKPEDDDGEIGTEERLYMNLRVEQERRHRSNRILKIMVPNNMYRYCTLVWLLLYSAIIVQICVRLFVFSWRDGVVFASSLVWSGVISEWDVLWWSKYGNPVWMREKKDGEDHQGQITLVDFV